MRRARITEAPTKRCGHEAGYRCACHDDATDEERHDHEPDVVEFMTRQGHAFGAGSRGRAHGE